MADAAQAPGSPPQTQTRFLSKLTPLWGVLLLLVLVLAGPLAWRIDPAEQDLERRLEGPSLEHPLGTDQLGRDLLSRVLHGGRLTLGVSVLVVLLSGALGTVIGVASGAGGGLADLVIARVIDVMVAMPFLLVALAAGGLSGGGVHTLVLTLGLFGWTNYARVARVETRRLLSAPMIEAARAVGAGPLRVFVRHLLPNIAAPLLVLAVVRYSYSVLAIAGLSFLGVGVQPPTPEWGAMLADGMRFLERAPHVLIVPGTAITLSCLVVSLTGESIRRRLNPHAR